MRTFMMVTGILALMAVGCGSQPRDTGQPQRVNLKVTEKGFVPAVVKVHSGSAVTLSVTRVTTRTCATELVLKEYGINQPLPLNEEVEITFTPAKTGDLTYACAMDMYRGTIRVVD